VSNWTVDVLSAKGVSEVNDDDEGKKVHTIGRGRRSRDRVGLCSRSNRERGHIGVSNRWWIERKSGGSKQTQNEAFIHEDSNSAELAKTNERVRR
jgi:hypothetical protein